MLVFINPVMRNKINSIVLLCLVSLFFSCKTQQKTTTAAATPVPAGSPGSDYWQQAIEYVMDIDFDTQKHQYKGTQQIKYINNSPDTLKRLYFHLFFNAFQPGSAMDIRSLTISDPDRRVGSRISKLQPDETGYVKMNELKINGKTQHFKVQGTVLIVDLTDPILPRSETAISTKFDAQVPIQIRRSGRNSSEGIDYSICQWYPKLAEYDRMGWHPDPYVGREFYGVWGSFDVTIHMDRKYTIAATGILQNPDEIGHGYLPTGKEPVQTTGSKLNWHFKAKNVHDFVWAADPDYKHTTYKTYNGTLLHFFFQENKDNSQSWAKLPQIMAEAMKFINNNYGEYPYSEFSFIQGGDGGMEYPMATLITGNRPLGSLTGVCVHEMLHSWYQGVLGSNESLYAWMDEGFTDYVENETMNELARLELDSVFQYKPYPHTQSINTYISLIKSGKEEPLSTHADHFRYNYAYSVASYVKGSVYLEQLNYIVGRKTFLSAMKRYFNDFKFKHPTPNDVIRTFEKESGMELHWFNEYYVNTTKYIDYSVDSVYEEQGKTKIRLKRVSDMIMPIDILVKYKDGSSIAYNIPLDLMYGNKQAEDPKQKTEVLPYWQWVNPTYTITLNQPLKSLGSVIIDPSFRMADYDKSNNIWSQE